MQAAAVGKVQERVVPQAAAALAAEVGTERELAEAEADTEEPADTAAEAEADNRPASAEADTEAAADTFAQPSKPRLS